MGEYELVSANYELSITNYSSLGYNFCKQPAWLREGVWYARYRTDT